MSTPPASSRPIALQPIVSLTLLTASPKTLLASPEVYSVLTTVWRISSEFDRWYVGDFMLMPDHLHLLARAGADARPLHAWIENWKSICERRLNSALKSVGPLWQPGYFGHYLRWTDSYQLECEHLATNPVRSGLCDTMESWRWRGTVFDLAD